MAGRFFNPEPTDKLSDHNLATGSGAAAGAVAGAVVGAVGGPIGSAAGAAFGSVTGSGAAAGAAIGAAGGPPGMIAGAAIGAAAGAVAGKAIARAVNPEAEDTYWRAAYLSAPYCSAGRTYDDDAPAYRLGYDGWSRYGGLYDDSERRLASEWGSVKAQSRLTWDEAKLATRAAWHRVERAIPGDFDRDRL